VKVFKNDSMVRSIVGSLIVSWKKISLLHQNVQYVYMSLWCCSN